MIDHIRYRTKLARLFRQQEKIREAFASHVIAARKNGASRDEVQSLEHQGYFEERLVDEEISILASDYVIREAQRCFVPMPSHEEEGMWNQCSVASNRSVLSNKGISELRSSLRKERKEQMEAMVVILATVTGLVGATTGLVALIIK